MATAMEHLSIGGFASAAKVNVETVRHYQRKGALGQRKPDDVREKLADLRRIQSVLSRLVSDCGKARGKVSCPLISALQR